MRNVIFDIGGVILNWNTDSIINSFVATVFDDEAKQTDYAATLKRDVFGHPDWLETDAGTLTAVDAIKRFAARTDQPVAEMQRLWDHSGEMLTIKEDTLELMRELDGRGVPIYCLSNMPVERFDFLSERFDFWSLFRGIVISGEVKLMKPDAPIFEYVLSEFNLVADESIFLDDTLHNVVGAEAVGIHGIHFSDVASCRDKLEALISG